eukprot:6840128-Pyramimonas_sp.AAC.1
MTLRRPARGAFAEAGSRSGPQLPPRRRRIPAAEWPSLFGRGWGVSRSRVPSRRLGDASPVPCTSLGLPRSS